MLDREVNDNIQTTLGIKNPTKTVEWIWIVLLMSIPLLYHIYYLVPPGVENYVFFGITLRDYGFPDTNTFIWYVNMKLSVLIPLCIWFLSNTYWWRYAILSPIILYTYQVWEVFRASSNEVDRYELYRSVPAILIVIIILMFLSRIIKYQSRILDLHQEVKEEIELILSQIENIHNSIADKKREFDLLKGTKVTANNAQEHMQSLLALRERLLLEMKDGNPKKP